MATYSTDVAAIGGMRLGRKADAVRGSKDGYSQFHTEPTLQQYISGRNWIIDRSTAPTQCEIWND